jgi:hypothetical protein
MERLRKLVRWAMREKVHGGCHNLAQVPRMIRGVFHEFSARPWGSYRSIESISSFFFEKTSMGISLISRVLRRGWGVRTKNFAERSCEEGSRSGSLRLSPPRCATREIAKSISAETSDRLFSPLDRRSLTVRLEQEGCQLGSRGFLRKSWSECSSGEKKAKLCAARRGDAQGWALI